MKTLSCVENLSLAYVLGDASRSPSENERLYGIVPGHPVRGQNLQVEVEWADSARSSVESSRRRTKSLLAPWDHAFLNERPEFASRVTLEKLTLLMASDFERAFPDFLNLSVRQERWRTRRRRGNPAGRLELGHAQSFQALLQGPESYRPLDFTMTLWWRGETDASSDLIRPWAELKAGVQRAHQKMMLLENPESWLRLPTEGFLREVAALISRSDFAPAELFRVDFADRKDEEVFSFLAEELS
jgi:hypothetical protein